MNLAWMLPEEAFIWIEENVPEGSSIIEFGSGHGSVRLSKRFSVTSIEHDPEWLGVASVDYIHAPIVQNPHATEAGEEGWYDVSIVKEQMPEEFDLVIIDGPPGFIGRTGVLSVVELLSKARWIIVDDVDRIPEATLSNRLASALGYNMERFISTTLRPDGSERAFSVIHSEVIE